MTNVDFTDALATLRAERLRRETGADIPPPETAGKSWPPDYALVRAWQKAQRARFELKPSLIGGAKKHYRNNPVEFINHWCYTYDPRNASRHEPVWLPLILFKRQAELVDFAMACLYGEESGLVEKSRDMGATWVCVAFSVWLWLFWDLASIGWGSATKDKVDRLGVPDSIFEKIRMLISALPEELLPEGFDASHHLTYMRCVNPETGSTIVGEIGDNIGRGGRTLVYFVDEAAHLAHPEMVEASLLETTRTRIDISSVSGLGTVFHRKRESGIEWVPGAKVARGQANIFIMDWSDHPAKTQEWYKRRKTQMINQGIPHIFAREVDRDYAAAVEGVIIPSEWVRSAVDAHKVLGIEETGGWSAALDVADGGLDKNAYSLRHSIVLKRIEQWSERDTGVTTRKAVEYSLPHLPINLQYDAIGVGSGVKAEYNRLREEQIIPPKLLFIPWFAGGHVLNPLGRVIEDDKESPRNKDFYHNLKAQAWWMLRLRFENTHRAVTEEDYTWEPEDIISLSSEMPLLQSLIKELSQATISRSTSTMKLVIDKAPDGTRSPNLADSVVMNYWPLPPANVQRLSIFGPKLLSEEEQ